MRDILAFSRDVLARLHCHGFPEAIVAGGAIRDYDNGRGSEVKDVDVVIFDRPGYLSHLKRAMHGFAHRVAVAPEVANYLEFENVECVHEFLKEGHPPIQVVVALVPRTALEILERHDFGICQVGFDGVQIIRTPQYVTDQVNKTFTLVRCRNEQDRERSAGRFARLVLKYPGWRMVEL